MRTNHVPAVAALPVTAVTLAVVTAVTLAAVTACHSAAPSAGVCRTSSLAMRLDTAAAGAAAGSAYYPIDFINTSAAVCVIAGYPLVAFVSEAGHDGTQIGAAAMPDPQFQSTPVRLAPGGTAHAWLQVAAAASYRRQDCRPATAHGLRVIPPGQAAPGYVRYDFPACLATASPLLTVLPVRGGAGALGRTP